MVSNTSRSRKSVLVFCMALLLTGCASPATPQPVPTTMPAPAATDTQPAATPTAPATETPASYADPFAYCAAVGTIDTPDQRYTGPKMPDSIVQGMLKQNIVSADAPADFQHNAVWRCMSSDVWVCHFGANIPCQEKADTSQVPTSAMDDFCKANPGVNGIPAAVTGRATIYEWNCKDGKATVGKQLLTVDPRGYLAEFWHKLSL
jgi:hypothetical protein